MAWRNRFAHSKACGASDATVICRSSEVLSSHESIFLYSTLGSENMGSEWPGKTPFVSSFKNLRGCACSRMDRRQEGANAEASSSGRARGGSSSGPPFVAPLCRPSSPDPRGSPPWLRPLWPPAGMGAARGQSIPGASPTPWAGRTRRPCRSRGQTDPQRRSAAAEAELLCTGSCHRVSASRPPRSKGLAPKVTLRFQW